MTRSALVVGATGLVGSHLVRLLCESTYFDRVVTITRRPMQCDSPKFEIHVMDFSKLAERSSLFAVDVMFSCLGTTRKQAGSVFAQRVVDYDYQLQAAKLAAANGVRHYLLVSSSGANANSSSAYLKMKGELEQQVKQLNFDALSVFQPSLLLGNRPVTRTLESLAGRVLPSLCKLPGLSKYRPIEAEQVAKKMLQVAQLPATSKVQYFSLDQVFPK